MHPIRLACAAAVLLASAGVGLADAADAVVRLGAPHTGEVPAGGGPSVIGVLVPAGTINGALKVKSVKGSLLAPRVALVLPDGTVKDADDLLAEGAVVRVTARSVAITKIPATAAAGLYKVLVTGADDLAGVPTSGGYTASFKGKPSKGFKSPITSLASFTDKDDWTISVPENAILTVTVKPEKLTPFPPSLQVLTAEGDVVDRTAFSTTGLDESVRVKKMPLPFFGNYTLRVGSLGSFGDYTILVKVKAGKPIPVLGAPVADAGGTVVFEPSTAGLLDGSASVGATSYQWVRVSGPAVSLSGRTTVKPLFTSPAARGTWAWQLVARNAAGTSLPALAILEVDRAPVASAGPSRSVAVGAPVTLDGSASFDLDAGDALRHEWTQVSGPAAVLDDPFAAQATFTPGSAGTYVFRLDVTDGTADAPFDTVVVVAGGAGPTPDAGREVVVRPQDSVYLSGLRSVSAAGGAPSSWSWSADPSNPVPVAIAGADGPVASFTAPKQPVRLRFRLFADAGPVSDDVVVVVTNAIPVNGSPAARAGSRQTVVQGASFTLDGSGSTDDASVQSYEWGQSGGADAGLEPSGATASGTAPLADDLLRFWLMVHDGRKYGPPDQVVVVSGTQGAPLADAGADRSGFAGQTISLTSAASIPAPGQTLDGWQWTQVSGKDWYDVDLRDAGFDPAAASPQIQVPTNVSSLTSTRPLLFELRVSDASGTSVADLLAVTFTGLPKNAPPQVTASASDDVFRPGSQAVLSASATDGDGDPLTYNWQQISGPTVVLVPNNLPQVSVTTPVATGTLVFRVTANDGTGEPNSSATADVSFDVNRPPAIVVFSDPQSGGEGTFVTLDGSGTTDPDDLSLTYAWTEIPPVKGGLVTLSGADTHTATFTQPALPSATQNERRRTFRLTVTDSLGAAGAVSATVNFFPNTKPVLSAITAQGDRKIFYSNSGQTIDRTEVLTANTPTGVTDSDGDVLTFAWRVKSGPLTASTLLSSTSIRSPTFSAPKPTLSQSATGGVYVLGVTGSDGAELSDEATVEVLVTASFLGDVYPMFQGACTATGCHGPLPGGTGLRLDQGATQTRTNLLSGHVSANDYVNSILYVKLSTSAMPKNGTPWSAFQYNMVRDWIEPEHNVSPKPGLSTGAENN